LKFVTHEKPKPLISNFLLLSVKRRNKKTRRYDFFATKMRAFSEKIKTWSEYEIIGCRSRIFRPTFEQLIFFFENFAVLVPAIKSKATSSKLRKVTKSTKPRELRKILEEHEFQNLRKTNSEF